MRPGERNVMILFLVMAGGAALLSLGFQLPEARLFPLIIATLTALLVLAYFMMMRSPLLRRRFGPYLEDDIFMKISVAAEAIAEDEAEEAARYPIPPGRCRRRSFVNENSNCSVISVDSGFWRGWSA